MKIVYIIALLVISMAGRAQSVKLESSVLRVAPYQPKPGMHCIVGIVPWVNTTIISIQWTQVSGPKGATIRYPNDVDTWFLDLKPGSYIFRITVKDSNKLITTKDIPFTWKK